MSGKEGQEGEAAELVATPVPTILAWLTDLAASPLQETPTAAQDQREDHVLTRLCSVLDEYQEQSYLLDPYLEQLVGPLVNNLRDHVNKGVTLVQARVSRTTRLIYFFTKVRGSKTVLKLFPHAPSDLSTLLSLFQTDSTALLDATWETRYILLLWLSLVVMLPFSLKAHEEQIIEIGMGYVGEASKERDAAGKGVLARYFSRPDADLSRLLKIVSGVFTEPNPSPLLASGIADTLATVLKVASHKTLLPYVSELLHIPRLGAAQSPKLTGRVALLLAAQEGEDQQDDLEELIQLLLEGAGATDSTHRYSSAKYLARLATLLPSSVTSELVEAVITPFIDYNSSTSSTDNGPVLENSFHGSCLTIAEFARRGLLLRELDDGDSLKLVRQLLECLKTAITFDHLHLSQSLGSSVRDSAAYALWSLARTIPAAYIAPMAQEVAQTLVTAALFDREVHVRRAASAALQEAVGRWGVFEHGIDLLTPLSFTAVGVRSKAFTVAAPQVALLDAYRKALISHLVDVTLLHYDPEMRELAAMTLGTIVRLEGESLIGELVGGQMNKLDSKDISKRHGALVALSALADATVDTALRERIFRAVTASTVPRSSILLIATSTAISSSSTPLPSPPPWLAFLEPAFKPSASASTQLAAAKAFSALSRDFDCTVEVRQLLRGKLEAGKTLLLGWGDWTGKTKAVKEEVVNALLSRSAEGGVEGRRNGVDSLAMIVDRSEDKLSPDQLERICEMIIASFDDYTIDQRGDVGSWIRLAAIKATRTCFCVLSRDSKRVDAVVSALTKQSVERLDGVREVAGQALAFLAREHKSVLRRHDLWDALRADDEQDWRSYDWAAERILPFIVVQEYRPQLLEGTVLGITPHSNANAFLDFALALPPSSLTDSGAYSVIDLIRDLVAIAKRNFSSNRLFLPCLTVLGVLLESGGLDEMPATELKQVLLVATRSIKQIKSWPRLVASAKIIISLLVIPSMAQLTPEKLALFLQHPMPTMRQHVAEELYAVITSWDGAEELQVLLAETVWVEEQDESAAKCVDLLEKRLAFAAIQDGD